MAKGIIVVDIPETCENCKLSEVKWDENEMLITCPFMPYQVECGNKQNEEDYCPIKPLPEKREELRKPTSIGDIQRKSFTLGFNACINEILEGDKENE